MASPETVSESNIKGVSVRAIIVLFLIIVFAVAVFMKINNEALNSVVMAVIGWYFGQKSTTSSKPTEISSKDFKCPNCSVEPTQSDSSKI